VPAKAGTHNHRLWNIGPRFRGDDGEHAEPINLITYHSAFAPTARTTLPKRSVSDAMNAANSAGVVATASAPCSVICLTTFGSRTARTKAALSLSMKACAIPAKPASVIVGASGSTGRRCGDVTAMGRTLPAWRNGSSEEYETKKKSTRPAARSTPAGAAPR